MSTKQWIGGALAGCAAAAALFACQDAVAPGRESRGGPQLTALIGAQGTVTVSTDSMQGWAFFDDQRSVACGNTSVCALRDGPNAAPLGSGSAELATPTASDGNALVLQGYAGTRFDHISVLRYSTYRQSADAGNNLAIALQFNVDYDLADQNVTWQGRLVFEPYHGAGGTVVQGAWQSWDATAGRWWGTKATVPRANTVVTNPCVQATPCTWPQLLSTFPNAGVHSTYGAVILKAGSSWPGFRGNVDSVAIGVDGATTVFNFDSVSAPLVHLRARIGAGVLGSRFPADTDYAAGTVINYSFSAADGRGGPFVVLDDTVASASGSITMDRPHQLAVETDTTYTIGSLSADGQAISQRISTLLTASDKPALYADMMQFTLDRLAAGANPAQLSHDEAMAWAVTVDPAADSASLDAVDEALDGYTFSVYWDDPGTPSYVEWEPPAAAQGAALRSSAGSTRVGIRPSARAATTLSPSPGARRLSANAADEEPSEEGTTIVYVNGVNTDEGTKFDDRRSAAGTTVFLANLVRDIPRFSGWRTHVENVYNKRASVQMAEYDALHPCVEPSMRQVWLHGAFRAAFKYSQCMDARNGQGVTMNDFVEAATARLQLLLHLPPTNPDVQRIAQRIQMRRLFQDHVIMVGHSEGTVLIAQAIGRLPSLEGHPIQVGQSCVASLSLASPGDRATNPLDEHYKSGFIVAHDIILLSQPTGWDVVSTPSSVAAEIDMSTADAEAPIPALAKLEIRASLHSIDSSYLRDPVAVREISERLVALHKECTQGELRLDPPTVTASAGTEFDVTARLLNQNGRELFGRHIYVQIPSELTTLAPNHFRANTPRDSVLRIQMWAGYVGGKTDVTVPIVEVSGTRLVEADTSWWELIAASNGGLGPDEQPFGWEQGPTGTWDGTEGSCNRIERIDGRSGWAGPSYGVFEMHCLRKYTVTQGEVIETVVAAQVKYYKIRYSGNNLHIDGGPGQVSCGPDDRLGYVIVEAFDSTDTRVAVSNPTSVDPPMAVAGRVAARFGASRSTSLRSRRTLGNAIPRKESP